MWKTRIVMPGRAAKGEVIEIKALVLHPMETGYRRDSMGAAVPRDIIKRFSCTYGGDKIFAMECFTGVAANPLAVFTTVATETGDLVFTWDDEKGGTTTETVHLEVT